MKNTITILFALLIISSCKKEEVAFTSGKYEITFTASKSMPEMLIVYNNSQGQIDTQKLSSTGLTFAYLDVKKGTDLFCTAVIDTPNTGYFKCTWALNNQVQKLDSVWMDAEQKTFTSAFRF